MKETRAAFRRRIWVRDGGICHICGDAAAFAEMHLDHVIPRALGGEDHERNLRVAHGRCNAGKQDSIGLLRVQRTQRPKIDQDRPPMVLDSIEFLTIPQAAKQLGIDRTTLARQAKKGVLKTTVQSPLYLVTAEQIDDYRKQHLGKRGTSSPLHPGTGGRPRKPPAPPHDGSTP